MNDLDWRAFAGISPGGYYDCLLCRLNNYRRWRWRYYLHACRQVPLSSPVTGSTSFERLNDRRGDLLDLKAAGVLSEAQASELAALEAVTDARTHGPAVAQLFLLSRIERRLRGKGKAVTPQVD